MLGRSLRRILGEVLGRIRQLTLQPVANTDFKVEGRPSPGERKSQSLVNTSFGKTKLSWATAVFLVKDPYLNYYYVFFLL